MVASRRGPEFNTFYVKLEDEACRYWTAASYLLLRPCNAVTVWRVGLNGGVKVMYNTSLDGIHYGYITNNPEAMKEFMWAKLSATPGPL